MSVNTKINGVLVKSAGLYKNIVPIGMGDIYSTEERQVGVWVDGKPLYQKTINVGNSFPINYDASALNIETCVVCVGTSKGYGNIPNLTPYTDYSVNLVFINNLIQGRKGSQVSVSNDIFATLLYTKTTDTAGSGIWTPSGSYAVHYSTDEQVIGTWVDGSTLYRKSFVFSSSLTVSHETFTDTGFSIQNLSKIIFGYLYRVANTGYISGDFNITNTNHIGARVLSNYDLAFASGSVLTVEYTKTA